MWVGGSLTVAVAYNPYAREWGKWCRLVPRRPYFPHSLALCCHYPVSKCRSASIVATSTLRVNCYCFVYWQYTELITITWVVYGPRPSLSITLSVILWNSIEENGHYITLTACAFLLFCRHFSSLFWCMFWTDSCKGIHKCIHFKDAVVHI